MVTGLINGNEYHYRLSADDEVNAPSVTTDQTVTFDPTGPDIEIWYGDNQTFGVLGNPQEKYINILGNVSDVDGVTDLSYTVDGGDPTDLTIGSDDRRLENTGDFNVDLDWTALADGPHSVVISATDGAGNISTKTVTVNYTAGNTWAIPYTADWSTLTTDGDPNTPDPEIQTLAQVVDGKWSVDNGLITTVEPGYDRLVALGDISWDDYEVLVPITIETTPSGFGTGLLFRWNGHTDVPIANTQPKSGYQPLGAIGWIRNNRIEFFDRFGEGFSVTLGNTYWMRMRVENSGSNPVYYLKAWPDGQSEPGEWTLNPLTENTSDPQQGSPQLGSLLLISHRAKASFGNVVIQEVQGAVNAAPTANDDNASVMPGGTTTIDVLANDTDADGTLVPGTVTVVNLPSNGSILNINTTTGAIEYQHDGMGSTSDNFTYTVEDDDGSVSNAATVNLTVGNNTSSNLVTDDFCEGVLNAVWEVDDPLNDATFAFTGSGTSDALLEISVPTGTEHQVFTSGINAPNILQPLSGNSNFEVEVKFQSPVVTPQYQEQGILVKESDTKFLRIELFSKNPEGNGSTVLYVESYNGAARNTIIGASNEIEPENTAPIYLRVKREGNNWTVSYRLENGPFTDFTFTYEMVVNFIGPYAGNALGGTSPAHTAKIDYFMNVTDDPLSTEDDCPAPNRQAPVLAAIGNQNVVIDGGTDPELTVNLLATDPDGPAADIDFLATGLPTFVTLVDNNDGTADLVINPQQGDEGIYPVTVTVTDRQFLTDAETFDIVVTSVDLPPSLNPIGAQNVNEGGTLTVTITATDPDGVDANIVFSETGLPSAFAQLTNNNDGTATLAINPAIGDGDAYPITITATDEDGLTDSEDLDINVIIPGTGGLNLFSEDFCSGVLSDQWAIEDPQNDADDPFISWAGTPNARLNIPVPGGTDHELWVNGIQAPHITNEKVINTDFELIVKFDSPVTQQFQEQGIMVKQDASNFLRLELYSDNSDVNILAGIFGPGEETTFPLDFSFPVNGSIFSVAEAGDKFPIYMRINRTGNNYTQEYSEDGATWTTAGTFISDIKVREIGLYGGNAGSNPAHVAQFDYIENTVVPIQVEDNCGACAVLPDGLALHLEGNVGVSETGGTVEGWADQSGQGNDLDVVAGDPQIISSGGPNGQPYIALDGTDDKLERNDCLFGFSDGSEDRTLFLVARYNSASETAGIVYGTGANNQAFGLGVDGTNGNLTVTAGGSGSDVVSSTLGVGSGWLSQSIVLECNDFIHYKNGSAIENGTKVFETLVNKIVLGEEIGAAGTIAIDIAAVLIYDRALSFSEQQTVEAYLQEKYFNRSCSQTCATFFDVTAPDYALCNGADATFDVTFEVLNGSGNYKVIDATNSTEYGSATGAATNGAVTIPVTISSPFDVGSIDLQLIDSDDNVIDVNDCNAGVTLTVNLPTACPETGCNIHNVTVQKTAECRGIYANFSVSFEILNGSGNYSVVDITNGNQVLTSVTGAATAGTVTIDVSTNLIAPNTSAEIGVIDDDTPACTITNTETVKVPVCAFTNCVKVGVKVNLQGPFDPNDTPTPRMRDDLRTLPEFPLIDPYGFGYVLDPARLQSQPDDNDDIVDWVKLELRKADDQGDPTVIVDTTVGLVKRNGEVIAPDGSDTIFFCEAYECTDQYFLAVFHRNHLAVMTAQEIEVTH